MDEAGEKLKRAFTGAFALLFAVIVLCAVFCNQNVFGKMCIRDRLTARINHLNEHLKANKNDKHSYRGLLKICLLYTSTTARPPSWTPSAKRALPRARPAASRSISARIR